MLRRWGYVIPIAYASLGRKHRAVHCAGEKDGKALSLGAAPLLAPLKSPAPGESIVDLCDDDSSHASKCKSPTTCSRCKFMAGIQGRLRRGHARFFDANAGFAWANQCTFVHPVSGTTHSWIVTRPREWGGKWGFGCFLCNAAGSTCTYGAVKACEPTQIQLSSLQSHQKLKGHRRALNALSERFGVKTPDQEIGAVSGLNHRVPRLDKWLLACTVVVGHESFGDFERHSAISGIGSLLSQEAHSDSSRKAAAKMILSLVGPLIQRDQEVIRRASGISLAFDERAQVLLTFARVLTKESELYECLLGLSRDYGTGHLACLKALQGTLRDACTIRRGRRASTSRDGADDQFDPELYKHLRQSVVTLASDGGPSEAKACYESSPLATDPSLAADPLFPNLRFIFRDAAHRHRSVQKGCWKNADQPVRELLEKLVSGEKSLAKMLQHSRRLSLVFEKKQRDAPESARAFASVLRNFNYAEQRFDSRSSPLYKIFMLLPVVIDGLGDLANDWTHPDDQLWAQHLLESFGGLDGYDAIVSAAVIGDAMILAQQAIRVCDTDDGDLTLEVASAAKLKHDLKVLLFDGAIFLYASEGTLVHAALSAIRGRHVFYRGSGPTDDLKVIAMGWPAPGDLRRNGPIQRAKAFYDMFAAFFDANFPMHSIQNCFAAFDLDAQLSLADRRVLLQALAERSGLDAKACWASFAGAAGGSTGALHRAQWHKSAAGIVANAGSRKLREPENANLRAWLRTRKDLAARPQQRKDFIVLVDQYLLSVPGIM